MHDWWYAECGPCKWREQYDTQDSAIRAAEDHVYSLHRDIPPAVRAEKVIGHVQNRTDNAVGSEMPQASQELHDNLLKLGASEEEASTGTRNVPEME